jgi:UDP-glucose 4-epimerase
MDDLACEGIRATHSHSQIIHVPYEEGFDDMERRLPDISKIRNLHRVGAGPRPGDILHDVVAWERAREALVALPTRSGHMDHRI